MRINFVMYNFSTVLALLPCLLVQLSRAVDLTVDIEAGRMDCYYQGVSHSQVIEVEYEVTGATHGEYFVHFSFIEGVPGGAKFVNDSSTEGLHKATGQGNSTYKICFDNSFSSFSVKTVSFSVTVTNDDELIAQWDPIPKLAIKADTTFNPEQSADIIKHLNGVRLGMTRVRRNQWAMQNTEAKGQDLIEGKLARVTNWSLINLLVLIIVGVIQVVMVKSLFVDGGGPSKISKGLAKLERIRNNFS